MRSFGSCEMQNSYLTCKAKKCVMKVLLFKVIEVNVILSSAITTIPQHDFFIFFQNLIGH